VDAKAAVRPAIIVGAICEMVALYVMGRSGPLQGNWRMGLQLLLIFFISAGATWLFVMARSARKPPP
jgi:hypothetical protein